MDEIEYEQDNGEMVTFDRQLAKLYHPHPSGSGTRVLVDIGGGVELHLKAAYSDVRRDLTESSTDRAVRSFLEERKNRK